MQKQGVTVIGVVADAGVEADCARVAETAVREYGRIDVLVNNAGMNIPERWWGVANSSTNPSAVTALIMSSDISRLVAPSSSAGR